MIFDGRKIRDEILVDLANKVVRLKRKPVLAEFLVGDDPVSKSYVELKEKLATKCGIQFCLYKFESDASEKEILECVEYLNKDSETDGIFIQIPLPKGFNREKIIEKISAEKDVDGLRFCLDLDSSFYPPVILAILEAIKRSGKTIASSTQITVIGKGFLVGAPLERVLRREYPKAQLKVLTKSDDLAENLANADIVISATGEAGIIKAEMVKEGVVLIDAGTAEENGELRGDIDFEAYKKASYYTPVPGGIGPVTVAMLLQNLIKK